MPLLYDGFGHALDIVDAGTLRNLHAGCVSSLPILNSSFATWSGIKIPQVRKATIGSTSMRRNDHNLGRHLW
jgi:hypothetical protein